MASAWHVRKPIRITRAGHVHVGCPMRDHVMDNHSTHTKENADAAGRRAGQIDIFGLLRWDPKEIPTEGLALAPTHQTVSPSTG